MTPFRFLDFPVTIRNQVYTQLLAPSVVYVDAENTIQESISTAILYVNKQIYAESSDVLYAKNLLTVISTNDVELFNSATRYRTSILCNIKNPGKVAACRRFAMTIEILSVGQKLSATGTPTYIVTAEALPFFASGIVSEFRYRSGTGSVFIEVNNIFRYTVPRFSELVFGRFLSAARIPKFEALRIEGPVAEEYRVMMMRKCLEVEKDATELEKHACGLFILGLDCYRRRVWFRMRMQDRDGDDGKGIKAEIPEEQMHVLSQQLLRKLDIFWDSHEYRKRELDHECSFSPATFFNQTVQTYDTLIHTYLLRAKIHPERAAHFYFQARCAAEEGIAYLNRDDRIVFAQELDSTHFEKPSLVDSIDRVKARLSLKASKACSRLGDQAAAVAYVEDADRYNPNMEPHAKERITKIRWRTVPDLPAETPYIRSAIIWKNPEIRDAARDRRAQE